jgi:hypothetical protein
VLWKLYQRLPALDFRQWLLLHQQPSQQLRPQ